MRIYSIYALELPGDITHRDKVEAVSPKAAATRFCRKLPAASHLDVTVWRDEGQRWSRQRRFVWDGVVLTEAPIGERAFTLC